MFTMTSYIALTKTAAILTLLTVTLSGCAAVANTTDGSATGDKYENSERVSGLIYMAKGTIGDGADDAIVNIEPSEADAEGTVDANTILPWTRTAQGVAGDKVKMTVKSLSSDGTVECQIFFDNIIIHNTASGDHATVTCEGTLDLK